jgi:hypothetical protein
LLLRCCAANLLFKYFSGATHEKKRKSGCGKTLVADAGLGIAGTKLLRSIRKRFHPGYIIKNGKTEYILLPGFLRMELGGQPFTLRLKKHRWMKNAGWYL